jgi:hypothetical protein
MTKANPQHKFINISWVVPGIIGGVMFGATVAGPFGVMTFGISGVFAGVYRDWTGHALHY